MLRDRPQDFILCRRIWPGAAGGWVSDIRWTASGVLKAHFQFGPLSGSPVPSFLGCYTAFRQMLMHMSLPSG